MYSSHTMVMSVSFPVVPQKTLKTLSGMCKHFFFFLKKRKIHSKRRSLQILHSSSISSTLFFLFIFFGGVCTTHNFEVSGPFCCATHEISGPRIIKPSRRTEGEWRRRRKINKSKRREDDGSKLCFFLYGPQTFHIEKYKGRERESGRVFLLLFLECILSTYIHER